MPELAPPDSEDKPRRVRQRVRRRVRVGPSRWHRYRKWWRKHNVTILLWGGFALLTLVLTVLVMNGYIRGPSPPPPE